MLQLFQPSDRSMRRDKAHRRSSMAVAVPVRKRIERKTGWARLISLGGDNFFFQANVG